MAGMGSWPWSFILCPHFTLHRHTVIASITLRHRDGYATTSSATFSISALPLSLLLLLNSVAPTNMVEAFDAVRAHVGMQFPGYINHETGLWSEQLQQWVFLPRRMSKEAYNYVC
jgi:hypothetical protein